MNHLVLMLEIAGLALGFPALAFAVGWSLLRRVRFMDAEERFAAAWGISFALMALSQFLVFAFKVNHQTTFNLAFLALALIVGNYWPRVTFHGLDTPVNVWPLAVAWGLGYAHLVCIQALLPNYLGSHWYYDWWMHYDESLVFLRAPHHPENMTWVNDYNLSSRTPLFNLAGAFLMSGTGMKFGTFQIADALLNSCFICSLYMIIRDLFGRRAAQLGALLAGLNLWMLHLAWFTWPKMLAAYFALLGLHFYIRLLRQRRSEPAQARGSFLFWVCMILGFLTHQVILVFFLALLAHALIVTLWDRQCLPKVRDLAGLAAVGVLLIGPWHAWLWHAFGLEKIRAASPSTQMFRDVAFKDVLASMQHNAIYSIYPRTLSSLLKGAPDPRHLTWMAIYQALTEIYFSLALGALTFSLTLFLIGWSCWAGWRWVRQKKRPYGIAPEWSAAWIFIIVGGLAAAALHPVPIDWGIAHAACFPSVLVLVSLGWGVLSCSAGWLVAVVAGGMVLEFLLMFYSHCWFVVHHPGILDPTWSNPFYKYDAAITFLNDDLGRNADHFLIAAIMVQGGLIWMLARWISGKNTSRDTAHPGGRG